MMMNSNRIQKWLVVFGILSISRMSLHPAYGSFVYMTGGILIGLALLAHDWRELGRFAWTLCAVPAFIVLVTLVCLTFDTSMSNPDWFEPLTVPLSYFEHLFILVLPFVAAGLILRFAIHSPRLWSLVKSRRLSL